MVIFLSLFFFCIFLLIYLRFQFPCWIVNRSHIRSCFRFRPYILCFCNIYKRRAKKKRTIQQPTPFFLTRFICSGQTSNNPCIHYTLKTHPCHRQIRHYYNPATLNLLHSPQIYMILRLIT